MMKNKQLFFVVFLLFNSVYVKAQTTFFQPFYTNTNLRVIYSTNTTLPLQCAVTNSHVFPLLTIPTYINDLKYNQDLEIINMAPNGLSLCPNSSVIYSMPGTPGFPISVFTAQFYYDGQSDIGIDSGIILSTGQVHNRCAQNITDLNLGFRSTQTGIAISSNYSSSYLNGTSNWEINLYPPNHPNHVMRNTQYPELVALNGGDSVWDANVVEFDIVAKGNFISLDYVFASEEWPKFTCDSTADVMGIFISGPGIVGQKNIAVLPGTNVPITTKTVYPAGTACKPESGGQASPYYVDNTGGQNIVFNGFTKVLRAASMVNPCDTYHIKLMVADGTLHPYDSMFSIPGLFQDPFGDQAEMTGGSRQGILLYDSGLLLKKRSLRSTDSIHIEALGGSQTTATYPYVVRNCLNGKFRLRAGTSLPINRSFELELGGNAVLGQDYAPINTTVVLPANATYIDIAVNPIGTNADNKTLTVKVVSPYGACSDWGSYLDSTEMVISKGYYAWIQPSDTTICVGCSVQLETRGESFLTYNWSPSSYLNQSTIANPVATPPQTITYQLTTVAPATGYPCPSGTNSTRVQVGTVGVMDTDSLSDYRIYPNPFTAGFALQLNGGNLQEVVMVSLTNVLGQQVFHQVGRVAQLNATLQTIGNKLPSGTYFLQVQQGDRSLQKRQVVKL